MAGTSKQAMWATRVAAWERSGLSRRVWCDRHGVNVHTLDYWRRRLPAGLRRRAGRDAGPGLIPLSVTGAAEIEILLPGGVRLRVPTGADVGQVVQWVQALRAC
jgi:transposase-like protein